PDTSADGLIRGVPEQLLCRRVPRVHGFTVRVHQHHGHRAGLDERLVVALLPLDLADVAVHRVIGDLLASDQDRRSNDIDVDKRAILSRSPRDKMDLFAGSRWLLSSLGSGST